MSITIRAPQPEYEIALSKHGWLNFLAFITELVDSASSEELAVVAVEMIKVARSFVLSREPQPEYKTNLSTEQVLDLFLFIGEFPEQMRTNSVMLSIHNGLQAYLLGGSE